MDQDLDLLKRCLTGEDSAWEALLRAYTPKIYNFCYHFTGRSEDARDLAQEIFIKIFQTLRTYDASQASFSTWLHRVARNHLVDHYRRTKRDRMTSSVEEELTVLEETPSHAAGPSRYVEAQERKALLQQGLDQLSPDLREAVVLRDLHDLDYAEIAQVLSIPQGTVKSRINRGRLELARVLKRMQGLGGAAKAGTTS